MASASEKLLEDKKTILVLGDSITQAGDYVTDFDAWLVKKYPERRFTVINAGVASETISGLSEDNHAGGRFPRPDLHERLERVLAKTKPDLIIACYGMNCGIYKELDEERSARFRDGLIRLRAAAKTYNAEIVHMTPPMFDNHGKPGFDYDSVRLAAVKQRMQLYQKAVHAETKPLRAGIPQGGTLELTATEAKKLEDLIHMGERKNPHPSNLLSTQRSSIKWHEPPSPELIRSRFRTIYWWGS